MNNKAPLFFGSAIVLAVAAALLAPDQSPPPPPQAAGSTLPEGHPPIEPGATAPAPAGPAATVLETMNSAGYTYARVSSEGDEIWVAGPETPLEVGDEISLGGAMGMQNFEAPSLGRTFESILFLNSFVRPGAGAATGAAAGAPGMGSAGAAAAVFPEGNRGTVLEVKRAAAYTYLRVQRGDDEVWLAALAQPAEVGMQAAWTDGMVMQNFDSPTLGMTFDAIIFVDGLQLEEG